MCFQNKAYDGERGKINDEGYRDTSRPGRGRSHPHGPTHGGGHQTVPGRKYQVKQSVGLYPTAGASDDYAYSRHFVDSRKGKLIAYTIEWGRSHASTPFHPPYPEMRKVMKEVSAGLLALCLRALAWNGRKKSARRGRSLAWSPFVQLRIAVIARSPRPPAPSSAVGRWHHRGRRAAAQQHAVEALERAPCSGEEGVDGRPQTLAYQPMRAISARPRASLRSVLAGLSASCALARRAA